MEHQVPARLAWSVGRLARPVRLGRLCAVLFLVCLIAGVTERSDAASPLPMFRGVESYTVHCQVDPDGIDKPAADRLCRAITSRLQERLKQDPMDSKKALSAPRAIHVLAHGAEVPGLGEEGDRLIVAFDLYRAGQSDAQFFKTAPIILPADLTGDLPALDAALDELLVAPLLNAGWKNS